MKRSGAVIVGGAVPDQASLRPAEAVRDLDEFLEFLASLEAIFGTDRQPRPPTIGERFLL